VGARTNFDETSRAELTELGVRRAFSFHGGVNARNHDDPMNIVRAGVFHDHPPEVVAAMAAVPGVLCSPSRHA
jgi:hypothetical protein